MTANLQQSFQDRLNSALALIKEYGIRYNEAGIFGSYARGDFKGTSDIDICLVVDEHPPRRVSGALREDCELLKVDIVFVTPDYLNNSQDRFAKKLRRDYKKL